MRSQAPQPRGPSPPADSTAKDSDEDSDPELQEVYVQSYACQIFRDDAAATSVEDGVHLRPMMSPQVDHYRWFLPLSLSLSVSVCVVCLSLLPLSASVRQASTRVCHQCCCSWCGLDAGGAPPPYKSARKPYRMCRAILAMHFPSYDTFRCCVRRNRWPLPRVHGPVFVGDWVVGVETVTQDPTAEPLMLDRFDARWMLDLADFNKGSASGSSLPTRLAAEVSKRAPPLDGTRNNPDPFCAR